MSDHDSATSSREAPKTTWKHPSELRIRTEEQLKCYTKAALFDHLQNLYPLVDEAEAERASIAHVHTLQREVDDLRRQLADKEALIISKDEVIALSKEKAALLSIHIQSLDRQQQHYAVETERERSQPHVDLHTQSPVADDDGDDQHIDEYNPQQAGYRSITHSTQHLSDDMGRLSATRQSDRRDGPSAQPDSSTARELNAQSTHPMAPGLEYLADALRQQTELAKRQADIAQMRPLPPFTGSESEESFETWLQRFEQRAERLDLPPSARLFHLQEYLDGEARRVYNDLAHSDTVSYGQLIHALKSKFNHRGAFAANHYLWSQLTQNDKESVDNYAHRVKELFRKTFTEPLPESARHSLLSGRFISGLRYHQLRQRLNTNYSQNLLPTFADVVSSARDFDRSYEDMSVIRHSSEKEKQNVSSTNSNRKGDQRAKSQSEQPTKTNPESTAAKADQNTADQTGQKARPNKLPPTPCMHCGEMHWNNDCPSRQNTAESAPHAYKKGAGSKGKNQQQNAATKGAVHQAATNSPSDLDAPDFNAVLQTLHRLRSASAQANSATVQADSLVGPSLTAPVSINGIEKRALFDSGSQISICSWAFLQELTLLKLVDPNKDVQQVPTDVRISSINSGEVEVCAMARLTLLFNDVLIRPTFFVQSKGATHAILIGINLFPPLNLTITDRVTQQPIFFDHMRPLPQTNKEASKTVHANRVYLNGRYFVPPGQVRVIRAELNSVWPGHDSGIFDPLESLAGNKQSHHAVSLETAVVRPEVKQFPLTVQNFGVEGVWLKKGMELGTVSECDIVPLAEVAAAFSGAGRGEEAQVSNEADSDQRPQSNTPIIDDPEQRKEALLAKIDWSPTSLASTELEHMKAFIASWHSLFALSDRELSSTEVIEHTIDVGSHPPVKQPPRPLPFAMRTVVADMIQDYLDRGVIRPSKSPFSSPIVLVRKKDGKLRFCVDYRRLNSITVKDAYALPRIESIFQSLHGVKYATCLDLASGYWQIAMAPESIEKTAFATHVGHFEFLVMPFGLTNAVATFQRFMEHVLAGINWTFVHVYLDDVLIVSSSLEEHLRHLRLVFERLAKAGIKLQPAKCKFASQRIEYLGHIITDRGILPDPEKVDKVLSYPLPKDASGLRCFLGLACYYQRFICGYSRMAAPLFDMLKKDHIFEWTPERIAAFETVRTALCTEPVLAHPDFKAAGDGTRPFILYTDASKVGLSAILSQKGGDGKIHPIAYACRRCSPAEQNYCATDLEAAALVFGVKRFDTYVRCYPLSVYTDHSALQALMTAKDPSARMIRWRIALQEYDLVIRYRAGRINTNADSLSRMFADEAGAEPTVAAAAAELQGTKGLDREPVSRVDLAHNRLTKMQRADPDYKPIWEFIESGALPDDDKQARKIALQSHAFVVQDGLLYFVENGKSHRLRLAVPQSEREALVHENHGTGHLGEEKVFGLLAQTFWWPHMRADVGRWCRACLICASARTGPHYRAPLKPIPVGGPSERVGVDVLSLPPTARGNSKVVVFIDYLTKWVECIPTADETADTIARLFIEHVVCRHGCPNELLSDRGPAFMSNLLAEVLKQCRVKKLNTSGWNPRCNGETERMNRTLIAMLKKTCAETTLDWDDQLPFVVFMYHNVEQASTQATPFALLFGRTCRMPTSTALHYRRPRYQLEPGTYAEQLQQHMAESWEVARGFVERAQQRQKLHYDKNSRSRRYQVGDRAFVHMPLETLNKDRKLSRPNYGPYKITAISDTNADLQLVDDDQVRLSVALDRLRPCYKEVPNISYTGRSKRRYVRRRPKEARAVGAERGQSRECEPAADQERLPYNLRSRQK